MLIFRWNYEQKSDRHIYFMKYNLKSHGDARRRRGSDVKTERISGGAILLTLQEASELYEELFLEQAQFPQEKRAKN